jgi:hypothetical protein
MMYCKTPAIAEESLVEVYAIKVIDPISKEALFRTIGHTRATATAIIAGFETYVDVVDRRTPLSLSYIEQEIGKARSMIAETTRIIYDLDQLFFDVQRIPGREVPGAMQVTLDRCLADTGAVAQKLFKRRMEARWTTKYSNEHGLAGPFDAN